jgi:hypothetical protein
VGNSVYAERKSADDRNGISSKARDKRLAGFSAIVGKLARTDYGDKLVA